MTSREIFLHALHREPTPRRATGSATSIATMDLMEQTGFFFPEVHLDPEKMAGLAAAGYTEIGFDCVAPLFSVFQESAALGCEVDWGAVDRMPACRHAPYAITDAIRVPGDLLSRPSTKTALEAIRLLKRRFGDEVAVVGKVFGPWTLSYHMFGVEEFLMNTLLDPDSVRRRLSELKEVTVRFALAQLEAGADALCLADHATRDVCSPKAYEEFLSELHAELRARIPAPLILHICGDTSDRIPFIRETGLACFHFDSKVPSATARELAGERMALMGGTSNFTIIREGTPDTIAADVQEKLAHHIDIIGPECAVPLNAPWRNMKLLAEAVKR
jgi:MtaA/CmuA family methyltransferase